MTNIRYITNGHNTLTITFISYNQKRTKTNDWGIVEKYNTDILHTRDYHNRWYLTGIANISTDVDSTVKFFNKYVGKYNRIVFIGSSMGAYAALLYGWLVSHDNKEIHAFVPQVKLDKNDVKGNWWTNNKVRDEIEPYISDYDRKYMELHKVIEPPENTFIYYGNKCDADIYQSDMISCKKVGFDFDSHHLPHYLLKNGYLTEIFENIYERLI